jgi:hypothetical protein
MRSGYAERLRKPHGEEIRFRHHRRQNESGRQDESLSLKKVDWRDGGPCAYRFTGTFAFSSSNQFSMRAMWVAGGRVVLIRDFASWRD